MGKKKKETMEFRYYDIPQKETVLALLGDSWRRVYGHDEFHLHFHNLLEVGYCRQGAGVVCLDEEKCRYSTGMISVIPANYPHITISDGEDTNFWEYIFFDPEQIIREIYPDNPIYQREMLDVLNKNAILRFESECMSLVDMIKMIMEEMRFKRPHYMEVVRSLAKALVLEIIRVNEQYEAQAAEPVKTMKNTQITAAMEYVNEHYASPLRAQELAAVCNMSETHFRRVFEENINMSPMDYVNMVRVQKACDLMKKTNDSMDIVAVKCGFATTSTFNRNFKKFLSTSPYQWKINPANYERKLLNFNISALKGW